MTVVAGVDIGNATTEVVAVVDGRLLGAARLPTRGRKGSADSLRGAAAAVRRLERRIGIQVEEARVAPLRAVNTTTVTVPAVAPPTGRLRLLAAGVATPGGVGVCVGVPMWLDAPHSGQTAHGQAAYGAPDSGPAASAAALGPVMPAGDGPAMPGAAAGAVATPAGAMATPAGTVATPAGAVVPGAAAPAEARYVVALVPAGFGYARAAARLRDLVAGDVPVGAVLMAGDEGVLVANRLAASLPVIDQVDISAAGRCGLLAVEVRPPGQPLTLLTDPVALGAALSLDAAEAGDAATLSRALVDHSNAVIGRCTRIAARDAQEPEPGEPWLAIRGGNPGGNPGGRMALRAACAELGGWPVGSVYAFTTQAGRAEVDDLFAVDLSAVAQRATARQGSTDHARMLSELLDRPVTCVLTEPTAARIGARTTPGARDDAVVVDLGAGTIDVIAPDGEVVAAGAGDLLTNAVAETLGISRAAADWVKRTPCIRVEGGQRFEAEDGSRGFLNRPAPPAAAGMLAVTGPAGLLPFDRRRSPSEWRAIRLRLKQAVFSVNLQRALATLGPGIIGEPAGGRQVLIAGGPAGDDELLGVLLRSLPSGVTAGRANVGGTLAGPPVGHRYAVALGLALSASRPLHIRR